MLDIDFSPMKRRPLFIQLFYSYVPIIIIALIVLVFFINQEPNDDKQRCNLDERRSIEWGAAHNVRVEALEVAGQ